jgi:hypothetical protein
MIPTTHSEIAWEVWYGDTFDLESLPSCEVRGKGIVQGLMELWARHLFETVRSDGSRGFSVFHLRTDRQIDIEGPWEGAVKLRRFLFGNEESSYRGYIQESNKPLLKKTATLHARLLECGQSSEAILRAANDSSDQESFEKKLALLASGLK